MSAPLAPFRCRPRRALAAAALLTLALLAPATAQADVNAHGTVISVTRGSGGSSGGGQHRPVYEGCHDVSLMVHLLLPITGHFGQREDVATDGGLAWRSCTRIADGAQVGWIVGLDTGSAPTTSDLAGAARSELQLPLPDVSTSPPRGSRQLDGVPVWFWMEHADPVSATASIPGLSATLTATPTSSRYTISDGSTLACPDLGTPYDAGRPSAGQRSDCTHTFDDRGRFTVTATVDWELSWVATDGESGTLPPVARTATFDLDVDEGQAVTD